MGRPSTGRSKHVWCWMTWKCDDCGGTFESMTNKLKPRYLCNPCKAERKKKYGKVYGALVTFTCRWCGKEFTDVMNSNRSRTVCGGCKRRDRGADEKVISDRKTMRNFTYLIVKHDEEDGFRPGATFSGQELVDMLRYGYLEGAIIKAKTGYVQGRKYRVQGKRMVEVAG